MLDEISLASFVHIDIVKEVAQVPMAPSHLMFLSLYPLPNMKSADTSHPATPDSLRALHSIIVFQPSSLVTRTTVYKPKVLKSMRGIQR